MGKIVLVTGGSRSGKSEFAERYAAKCGKNVGYIATAEVYDSEMAFRVKLHRERRPHDWQTFEAPYDAHETIAEAGRSSCDTILFDCLTIYVSNILCSMESISDSAENYRTMREQIDALIAASRDFDGTVIFVTNEVGSGIVPENHLAREYRDIAGLVNQWVGAASDEVYLVTCGIAVNIKNLAVNLED